MSSSMEVEKAHKLFIREDFPEHAKKTLSLMLDDAKEGLFCDVNLVSGLDGKKFAAHRSVLSRTNDFFRTMFLSGYKEAEDRDVTLSDISANILEAIINFCYTGIIEINEDNVQLLLPQAHRMLFTDIVDACSDFLVSLLSPTNCLNIYKYSKLIECDILSKGVQEFMYENFLNVVATQEFLDMDKDELEEYFSSDKLSVNNEKEVFEALIRWINHDQNSRISFLNKLLSVVRLKQVDSTFLLEYILSHCDDQSNLSVIAKSVKEHFFNAHQTLPERTGSKANRLAFVYKTKIILYNPITSIIEFEYSFDCNNYVSALVDEKVILVGTTKVQSFDLKTRTCVELPATQTARRAHAVAVVNGHIYAIGGENENTVERWDPKLNKWIYVASMQQKRSAACTVVLKGTLFVMGGNTLNNEKLNSVECYNPLTNKWSSSVSMLEKKAGPKAVIYNGEIYVFGGQTQNTISSSIEKYNSETDSWFKISEMNQRRAGLGACLFNENILLFGGHNGQKWSTTMEKYNPLLNESELIPTTFAEYQNRVDIFSYLSTNNM